MKRENIKVDVKSHGKRLDIFLSDKLGISRSQVKKMIKGGGVFINGEMPKKAGEKINEGKMIEVGSVIKDEEKKVIKKEVNLFDKIDIVSESEDYVVINKPSGLLVHPTEACEKNTLVDWLVGKYPHITSIGQTHRWGIVHRLDKSTSGLMVIALSSEMFDHLKSQFKKRKVSKEYIALVHGKVEDINGKVDFDIARGVSGKMVARPKMDELKLKNVGKKQAGKRAITTFEVVKRYSRFTLLNVKILTGRTHQIRVHFFSIDHPLLGDSLYYNKNNRYKKDEEVKRIFLHSAKLGFTGISGEKLAFSTELPAELEDIIKDLN